MKPALFAILLFLPVISHALSFDCDITDVGRSFNQTDYEVTVSASERTSFSGTITVYLTESGRSGTQTVSESFPVQGTLKGTETLISRGISGIRAESCSVSFSGNSSR